MSKIDMTGRRYGRLTVVRPAEHIPGKQARWECLCDCGNTVSVDGYSLRRGMTSSCGCLRRYDIIGRKYGRLTVKEFVGVDKWGEIMFLCSCDCGNTTIVRKGNIIHGYVVSCGCKQKENLKKARQSMLKTRKLYRTNPTWIASSVPNRNSTTGVKGVGYVKSTGKYEAYIGFQRQSYKLLVSKDIDACIQARKEAEKHIFGDFLDWYEANVRQVRNRKKSVSSDEANKEREVTI